MSVFPSSDVIERLLISASILDASARDQCVSMLCMDDFFAPQRGELWELIARLPRVDLTIVQEALHGIQDVGREVALRQELDTCIRQRDWTGTDYSIADYCEELRDRRVCRELIAFGGKVCVDGSHGIPVGADFIDQVEATFSRIIASRQDKSNRAPSFEDELSSMDSRLETGVVAQEDLLASTGVPALDRHMGDGIRRGDFYVLLGRPGDGKSVLAMQMVRTLAIEHRVLVFNFEMTPKALTRRVVASATNIPADRIARNDMSPWERQQVRQAIEYLRLLNLRFMPHRDKTIDEIKAGVREEARKHGRIGAIVVDYMQLMNASRASSRATRDQQLAEVSRGLKALTIEHDCAVIAISSMNRDMKNRQNKRPTMSDVRECGSIEFDANNIIGIYRPDGDPTAEVEEHERGTAELILIKQREGRVGIVHTGFDGSTSTFGEKGPSIRRVV